MKTIEEKAKAYDEALERAKEWEGNPAAIDYIFPELAESEDEKVRQKILFLFYSWRNNEQVNIPNKKEVEKAISWLEKQGQVKESTISQHENKTCEENGNSLTYEDEKVRKEIINYFRCQSEEEPTRKEIHDKWIAWLENIPYTIDHEKREGFHLGYRACLEKQGEQKSIDSYCQENCKGFQETGKCFADGICKAKREAEQKTEENKGNVGGISANWSEEDEENFCSVYLDVKSARQNTVNSLSGELKEQEQKRMDEVISWLKSLRPQNRWKPSEDDIIILEKLINGELEPKVFQATLQGILEQLKKLKEK